MAEDTDKHLVYFSKDPAHEEGLIAALKEGEFRLNTYAHPGARDADQLEGAHLLVNAGDLDDSWTEPLLAANLGSSRALLIIGNINQLNRVPDPIWTRVHGVILRRDDPGLTTAAVKDLLADEAVTPGPGMISILRSLYHQGRDEYRNEDIDALFSLTLSLLKIEFQCSFGYFILFRQGVEGKQNVSYQMGSLPPVIEVENFFHPDVVQVDQAGEASIKRLFDQESLTSLMWSPIPGDAAPLGLFLLGKREGMLSHRDLESLIMFSAHAARIIQYIRLRIGSQREKDALYRERQDMIRNEKVSTMGRLMTSVAHQLNNPLQAIQINLDLAQRKDLSQQKRAHYLEIVQDQVKRLRSIVGDMIRHYRPGQQSRLKVSVNDLILDAVSYFEPRLDHMGIEFKVDLDPDLPDMWGFPDQLSQVFIHLISNAVDAMPEGGRITIRSRLQKGQIRCMIKDTGMGIPEEDRTRIFDPFFTTKENCHGLGLTICDNIVNQHQGEIKLRETDQEGTCFVLTLPIGGKA